MGDLGRQSEFVDVVVVGAGMSGIGAACHLRRQCAGKSLVVLEGRDDIGGTWDLFRYPGIRSDSDMFTFGYRFRPWTEAKCLADGRSILDYIRSTAADFGIDALIRCKRRVVAASWDTTAAMWTVTVLHTDSGQHSTVRCGFLYVCSGYYRYDQGFIPTFPGAERFTGQLVHPQHWPEDLDYGDRNVVVIGSGATAVSLVPTLAETAAHVCMLQRSPTYVSTAAGRDALADWLRARLPARAAYAVIRWKKTLEATAWYSLSRRRPKLVKWLLRRDLIKNLPVGYDIDTHFTPRYDPWDQRMCPVPDGDLFTAISEGRVSVVTDTVREFTESGVALESGAELPADIIVTATGLNMLAIGGIQLTVNGRPIDVAQTVSYKGAMLSGVPNFAWTVGYTNAAWTLKADLVADYMCRLIKHMDRHGYASATPDAAAVGGTGPFLELTSGYVLRSLAGLPKQGAAAPWRLHQNYLRDVRLLRRGRLDDDVIFEPREIPASRTSGLRAARAS